MYIDAQTGLPLRGRRTHQRTIIAHHIILNGYGHWPPNDLRGSGSKEIRQRKLSELGEIHFGRKTVQPPREEVKQFRKQVAQRLSDPLLWFDESDRALLGRTINDVAQERNYTIYACAILKNHVHLCVRRHRDDGRTICLDFMNATRVALLEANRKLGTHRIWAERPYAKFLDTPTAVRGVVKYIEENPEKEGLPRQQWPFVVEYDGWPFGAGRPRRDK